MTLSGMRDDYGRDEREQCYLNQSVNCTGDEKITFRMRKPKEIGKSATATRGIDVASICKDSGPLDFYSNPPCATMLFPLCPAHSVPELYSLQRRPGKTARKLMIPYSFVIDGQKQESLGPTRPSRFRDSTHLG